MCCTSLDKVMMTPNRLQLNSLENILGDVVDNTFILLKLSQREASPFCHVNVLFPLNINLR